MRDPHRHGQLFDQALRAAAFGWICAISIIASAAAQDTEETVAALAGEPTILVIGERKSLLTIPGSGATLDEQQIERSNPFTINEVLRQLPGLFPRDEEGMGLRPNIGVRGLNPTRSTKILLLEDGIPLAYAPYGDNASYYHPPLERFSRIEALKGASQIRFGPQTIGGVINYITPPAPFEPEAEVSIAGGDPDYLELDANGGGPALGGRVYLHGNHKQSAGARKNLDLQTTDLFAKGQWDLGASQDVALKLNWYEEDSQITYSGLTLAEFQQDPFQNPFHNDEFKTERFGASLAHGWIASDWLDLTSIFYATSFDRDWWRQSSNSGQRPNDASDPLCVDITNLDTTCGNEGRLRSFWTYGLESRLDVEHERFGFAGDTEIGFRIHQETQDRLQINSDTPRGRTPGMSVNGGIKEDNERDVTAYAGFVQSRFRFGELIVEPGVRIEHIEYERTNNLAAISGATDITEIIPGLGAVYRVGRDFALYGGVHKGFAPPRVEDIISNTTGGSVDLDSEQSVNYELGLRGYLAPGVFADLGLFRMEFDNQIVPASVAGGVGATLTSAGETLHQGAEFLLDASLRDAGVFERDDIYLRAAVTYVGTAKFEGARFSSISGSSTVSVTGNRLPYSPKLVASAAIGYSWSDTVEIELEAEHTGEMFSDDLNTIPVSANGQQGLIEDVTIYNATINFTPPGTNFHLFVAAKNLTDEIYVVDRARGILPGAPRMFQAGIGWKL